MRLQHFNHRNHFINRIDLSQAFWKIHPTVPGKYLLTVEGDAYSFRAISAALTFHRLTAK
jgi:hypothetical protein